MKLFKLCLLAIFVLTSQAADAAGTFRFLSQTLPDSTTDSNYNYRLVTANANGAVTFSIIPDPDILPTGITLDSESGYITGIPDSSGNYTFIVRATDQSVSIDQPTVFKVSSSGGGGSPGIHFELIELPGGRIGTAYDEILTVAGGTGPFTFMTKGLPGGLSTNGRTGEITGTPSEAGTFLISVTALDQNDNSKSSKILPLTVLPELNDFQFATKLLNNGEVGTPFSDQYLTLNEQGTLSFSATGLPLPLVLDSLTGAVSGTPTVAGTFEVSISANDGTTTISTNLLMTIAPSSTSSFYWTFTALPIAIQNIQYDQQPAVEVIAANGDTVTYTATGLPTGITYGATTGILSGTATVSPGIFPVTFTASDSVTSEILTLKADFIVLSEKGGDEKGIIANFFVLKQQIKSANPGKDSWKTTIIYNDDRTDANRFDPDTDNFLVAIGDNSIELLPGDMIKSNNILYRYKNVPTEINPAKKRIDFYASKQLIKVVTIKDTISETFPGTYLNTLSFKNVHFRLEQNFDEKGKFNSINGYKQAAFVVYKFKCKVVGPDSDKAQISMYMLDPTFSYTDGDTVQLIVKNSSDTEIINKDITNNIGATTAVDKKTGVTVYKLKRILKDDSETNTLSAFKYETKRGKLMINLTNLDLGLSNIQEHVSVELIIKNKFYTTGITLFDPKASGSYSEKMPKE